MPQRRSLVQFLLELILPQGHSAAGGVKAMENLKNPIGNRTRDFPVGSAVPQLSALLCTPATIAVNTL